MNVQSLPISDNIKQERNLLSDVIELNEDKFVHHQFKKEEYIFKPNQFSDKIYLITSGRVKIGTYGNHGKKLTKAIIDEWEIFGELSISGENERRDFAYAMEDTNCYEIQSDKIISLIEDDSNLALFFIGLLGKRIIDTERKIESLVFKDSRNRIMQFIVDLIEKRGQRVGYEWLVRKFFAHQEIADITSTSRQTVTTVLNELKRMNLLICNRSKLLVRDLEQLKLMIR